jgi:hypothetical protein
VDTARRHFPSLSRSIDHSQPASEASLITELTNSNALSSLPRSISTPSTAQFRPIPNLRSRQPGAWPPPNAAQPSPTRSRTRGRDRTPKPHAHLPAIPLPRAVSSARGQFRAETARRRFADLSRSPDHSQPTPEASSITELTNSNAAPSTHARSRRPPAAKFRPPPISTRDNPAHGLRQTPPDARQLAHAVAGAAATVHPSRTRISQVPRGNSTSRSPPTNRLSAS